MTPATSRPMSPADAPPSGKVGHLAVVLMVVLGVGLALVGVLHQRSETVRCLRFLGAAAARRVAASSHVELLRLRPGGREGRFVADERWDVSTARGVVHLRRGLVEDANYDWGGRDGSGSASDTPADRLPSAAWRWAIAFAESPQAVAAKDATILAFAPAETDHGEPGWMTRVGAPGRVRLGRIERGLSAWIEGFLSSSGATEQPVGLGRIGKQGGRRP